MELTREQINEAKRTTDALKAQLKRVKEKAGKLKTKFSGAKTFPGYKEQMNKIQVDLDAVEKFIKDKPSTSDVPNSYTKKVEAVEKKLGKMQAEQDKYSKKQSAIKTKYEAGKKKQEKERKAMSGKYATESVDFKSRVRRYLPLNEMAMKHFGPDAEKKYSKEELKGIFDKSSADSLANTYVKNAKADEMEDKKIAQGLGATLRNMEDKDKVAKVKEAVRAKLELAGNKPKAEKETGKKEETKKDEGKKPGFLGKKK